jgi:hypothetical protein
MKTAMLIIVGLGLTMTACVSITEITPAGKDTYIIAGSDSMEATAGVNIKAKLYQKANEHCESIGKKLMPVGDASSGYSAQLRFQCLDENDPDFVRPDMQPVPDVRIETKH